MFIYLNSLLSFGETPKKQISLFLFIYLFIIIILLYNIVLVLPYINMHLPWV